MKRVKKFYRLYHLMRKLHRFILNGFIHQRLKKYYFVKLVDDSAEVKFQDSLKNAFDVDILEEYWSISSKKVSIDNMITLNYTNILSPLKISAAYFSVKKEGKLVNKPDRSKFSFTDMTWRFSKIGDVKEGKLESVAESDFFIYYYC